jgi:hypothetical protein
VTECSSDKDCPSTKYCNNGKCKGYDLPAPSPGGAGACTPQWQCGLWTECELKYSLENMISMNATEFLVGKYERSCVDTTNCLPGKIESFPCRQELPIRVETETFCGEQYTKVFNKETNKLIAMVKKNILKPIYDISLGNDMVSEQDCWYCSDGLKDYGEVYTDCGGEFCPGCELNKYAEWYKGVPVELTMEENVSVSFMINGTLHKLTVLGIWPSDKKVLIRIESDSMETMIYQNETNGYDLTGDGSDDILVTLKRFDNGKAVIWIKKIVVPTSIFEYLAPAMKVIRYQSDYVRWDLILWAALAGIVVIISMVFRDTWIIRRIIEAFGPRASVPEVRKKPRFPIIKSKPEFGEVNSKPKVRF